VFRARRQLGRFVHTVVVVVVAVAAIERGVSGVGKGDVGHVPVSQSRAPYQGRRRRRSFLVPQRVAGAVALARREGGGIGVLTPAQGFAAAGASRSGRHIGRVPVFFDPAQRSLQIGRSRRAAIQFGARGCGRLVLRRGCRLPSFRFVGGKQQELGRDSFRLSAKTVLSPPLRKQFLVVLAEAAVVVSL